MARPGVVDLRDLAHRYAWRARTIEPFLAAAGLEPGVTSWRSFDPPPVVVLVVDADGPEQLAPHVSWLARAALVLVVRDAREDWLKDDRDLRESVDAEWRTTCAPLRSELHDWRDDATARVITARAIELARSLPDPAPGTPREIDLDLPVSPWRSWTGPKWRVGAAFAAALATRDERATIVDERGDIHDLASPVDLVLGTNLRSVPAAYQTWCGVDPSYPVRWSGQRMGTYWWHAQGPGLICRSEHDWPCGPAKKRWFGDDNEPQTIALAPDASACLHHFDFDAMLTEEVPLEWQRAGDVDVATFPLDRRRALFFHQSVEFLTTVDPSQWNGDLLSDDARERRPAMVLGPSTDVRYAIDLTHRTLRIRGHEGEARVEHVGGPTRELAIYDRDHALVRRAPGRLLGGWYRHATIEDRGTIWREDLATGARSFVAPASPRPDEVEYVPVPGTRNLLEIASGMYRVL